MTCSSRALGVIRADESYTVAEFKRRASLGDYAYGEARRAGLPIIKLGKKRYVLGRNWIEFLSKQPSEKDDGE